MKQLIERYFEVFNSGDAGAMLGLVDDNISHEINQGKNICAGSFLEIKNNKIIRVSTYCNLPHWIELVK